MKIKKLKIKKAKVKKTYVVYCIKHNDQRLYIGYTDNIIRRQKQHNYLMKKGMNKLIYNYFRNLQLGPIVLEPIRSFDTKTEAKRFEAYLILLHHFYHENLLQKIPSIGM